MKYSQTAPLAVVLYAAQLVHGQTPAGSEPSCEGNLGVKYNGTRDVITDEILFPDQVSTQPTIYSNDQMSGTYMVVFTDLSISGGRYNGTSLPLAQGLQSCRTTRLHWLQTGLTQNPDGTFTSDTPAIAPYGGSMPTLNDIPHTFTFYLFPQPDGFELPGWDAGRNYTALGAPDRLNFSVTAISDVVGAPTAANYYRTFNRSNTATGSFSNGTCPVSLGGDGAGSNSTGGAGGNSTGGGSGGSGSGTGGSGTGSSPPPASFTGVAGKVESGAGALARACQLFQCQRVVLFFAKDRGLSWYQSIPTFWSVASWAEESSETFAQGVLLHAESAQPARTGLIVMVKLARPVEDPEIAFPS
ncbi:hypothetical protein Q7P37_004498 [Cladosporium fusiforme]